MTNQTETTTPSLLERFNSIHPKIDTQREVVFNGTNKTFKQRS